MYKSTFIYLLVIALLGSACSSKVDATAESPEASAVSPEEDNRLHLTPAQFEAGGMALGPLEDYSFATFIRSYGTIDVPPQSLATVSVYYGGYVHNLRLLPGQYVRRGQLLFALENPDFIQMQQDFLEAKGQLIFLKGDFERQKTLAEENIASQKNYLKAQSDYQVTLVRFESMKKKLELLGLDPNQVSAANLQTFVPIIAPISGYITTIHATQGAYLQPMDEAVTITNTEHIHLELDVYEKDMNKLQEEQEIVFRLPDSDGPDYLAEVHLIGKEVDPEKRTINVHGHLQDESLSSHFVPGMFVEADITTERTKCKSLPEQAVVQVENQYYVLHQLPGSDTGYTFERRMVRVGKIEQGRAEILNADEFMPGDVFLVEGAFNMIQ